MNTTDDDIINRMQRDYDLSRAACDAIQRLLDGTVLVCDMAVKAERERCAKVAEALDRSGREWVKDSLFDSIRKEIAREIRRGDDDLYKMVGDA